MLLVPLSLCILLPGVQALAQSSGYYKKPAYLKPGWRPKSYGEYLKYCLSHPSVSGCSSSSWAASDRQRKQRVAERSLRLNQRRTELTLRKQQEKQQKAMDRTRRNRDLGLMGRVAGFVKDRWLAALRGWHKMRMRLGMTHRMSPFEISGGFGETIARRRTFIPMDANHWLLRRSRVRYVPLHSAPPPPDGARLPEQPPPSPDRTGMSPVDPGQDAPGDQPADHRGWADEPGRVQKRSND